MNCVAVVHCWKCDRSFESEDGLSGRDLCRAGWDSPVFIATGPNQHTQTALCPRHARWWTLRYWARRFEWRIGKVSQRLSPGFSWCGNCLTTWAYAHEHVTHYSPGRGCFALCEKCWRELTPPQRLPFYADLFREWERTPHPADPLDGRWQEIREAVLNEERGETLQERVRYDRAVSRRTQ